MSCKNYIQKKIIYTKSKISKWERGADTPNVFSLYQLTKYLGVTIDHLLEDDDLSLNQDITTNNLNKSFGEKVRERRHNLGMSQNELAEEMGYKNRSMITHIEKGITDLPLSKLILLADILKVPVTYLLDCSESSDNNIQKKLIMNGDVSDRIKNLRIKSGMTQEELAEKINRTPAVVSYLENNKRKPTRKQILQLSAIFNVSESYFLGTDDDMDQKKSFIIPVLNSFRCKNLSFIDQKILDWEEIDYKLKGTGKFFGLKVKDDSMMPKFEKEDIVIIRIQETIKSGDIGVVLVNGDKATLKKIEFSSDGITLTPLNAIDYPTKHYTTKEIQDLPVMIIGKVIEQRRKF